MKKGLLNSGWSGNMTQKEIDDAQWEKMVALRDERQRKALRRAPEVKHDLLEKVTFDQLRKHITEDEVGDTELTTVIHRVRKFIDRG